MMWKDQYELGNELVDSQHKELFSRVAALNEIVEGEDAASRKQECINAILFLKDYAVNHFADEEKFQESLNYRFLEFHKAIHSSFVDSVLDAEKKLVESDFSLPVVKEFCGFLSMWLIYHVAGADQKIVAGDVMTVAEFAIAVSYEDCVMESLRDIFDTILGDSVDVTKSDEVSKISHPVLIEIDYDETRNMRLMLSKVTALSLVSAITNLELTEVDELVHAVLEQFARTISGNASSHMKKNQQTTEEIKLHPDSPISGGEFFINTKFGRISTTLVKKEGLEE